MSYSALICTRCGAQLEVESTASSYICPYCKAKHERDYSGSASATPQSLGVMAERAIQRKEFGKAMQFIEQGLAIDPHNGALQALEARARAGLSSLSDEDASRCEAEQRKWTNRAEAENYHLQAQFILNELHANLQVYGTNSAFSCANPANVDLALQYINRSLELFPDNPIYLNLKGLLLAEGKNNKEAALPLFERAAALAPRDINIQNNLKAAKSANCFVATAAYGTPMAQEIHILRRWRDDFLKRHALGRRFVSIYYRISPPVADYVAERPTLRRVARGILTPLIWMLMQRGADHLTPAAGSSSDRPRCGGRKSEFLAGMRSI